MGKRALISVSDKTNILDIARFLMERGYSIVSTGGTAEYLSSNGIAVQLVSSITNFPEILNGRVKTLHPHIMGGILADRTNNDHLEQLFHHGIKPFDLIIVNLYPFKKVLRNRPGDHEVIIENIDIGGPNMVRAAAKNYKNLAIVTDINDYCKVMDILDRHGELPIDFKFSLAQKAFTHIADYDIAIAEYFSRNNMEFNITDPEEKKILQRSVPLDHKLRYGENPHQKAHFYSYPEDRIIDVLFGKELSFNNYLDIDAALKLISKFKERPAVAILKHTNPCGVGQSVSLDEAYHNAFLTDPLSPFGGIVVTNRVLDMLTAQSINKVFTEIIIAPGYEKGVLEFLKKKKNRRVIVFDPARFDFFKKNNSIVSCLNGILEQETDYETDCSSCWKVVTEKKPTDKEFEALLFAWRVVSALKSNAVCFSDNQKTYGLGIGQTSRIDSTEIAINKALKFGHDLSSSVCASDGFFPFKDSIEILKKYNVKSVIQPGGSKGDEEVIAECNKCGISMIFTNMRHFRH